MKLKVYADRMSQPSRAVLIFCKVNGIEFDEIKTEISKKQQKSPEYKGNGVFLMLYESAFHILSTICIFKLDHAILVYLACAFPGVADHWYPADLFKRAKIDSVLHWHHTTLRRGAAPLVLNSRLAPVFGLPLNLQAAAEAEKVLTQSLAMIESIWLEGKGRFLLGSFKPSIADLSLVCEIMQLELLDERDRDRILGPHKKVLQWVEDTKKATRPHFDEIHELLFKLKVKLAEQWADGAKSETVTGGKREMFSKM